MAYSDVILAESSLVGYWRLGESSGTLVDSKNGNNATSIGGLTYSQTSLINGDNSNAAIDFSGSSSGATIGNVSALSFDGDSPFSIEFIVKPDAIAAYYPIFGKVASPDQGYEVGINDNRIQFSINYNNGSGWHQLSSDITISVGTTYHVTVIFDVQGSNRGMYISIDGIQRGNSTHARGSGTLTTSASACIGHRLSNVAAGYFNGVLDEVAVYNTNLTPTPIHQHCALPLATRDGVAAAWSSRPKLIIDTDCSSDPGDPGALAVACALAARDECDILAFITDTATANIAECVDAISTYYQQSTQPIGKRASGSPEHMLSSWVSYLPSNFPLSSTRAGTYPDAVAAYRQALHDAADASVTIVSIGFLGVIRDLMVSVADGIDSRNGMDLIAAKVLRMIVMGGEYPSSGTPEFNFTRESSATTGASYVVTNWPTSIPIYFTGYELGLQVFAGTGLAATPADNPVRYCYNADGFLVAGREAWDETAILFAVRNQYYNNAYYWTLTRGTNSVNGTTGANTFTPSGGGPHYYLTLKAPAELISTVVDGLTAALPSGYPVPITYAENILDESPLVGYWRLGESSGTTATDTKGAQDGTYSNVTLGATSLVTGSSDAAATFNGTSAKVSLGSSSFLNYEYTQAWTIEFLLKPNSARSGSYVGEAILSKLDSSAPYKGFEVGLEYNGNVASKNVITIFLINDFGAGRVIQCCGTTDLLNATTYHVVVAYSGSGLASGVFCYINGVAETLTTIYNGLVSSSITNSITPHIGCRNGIANFYKGDLDEVAVYNFPLRPEHALGHYYLAFGRTPLADSVSPVNLIVSTDLAADCDDAADIACAAKLAAGGECNLLAVVTDSANVYSAPTAKSILEYYGQPSVPVYAWTGSNPSGAPSTSNYASQVTTRFKPGQTRADYTDSKTGLRTALHNAADYSVVICMTGFATAIYDLLTSAADGIDSRNGVALVTAKVKRLVVVAGIFPTGTEWNCVNDPSNYSNLLASWPTDIVYAGIELIGTTNPYTIVSSFPATADPLVNPAKYAFDLYPAVDNTPPDGQRAAWGQMGVLYAVRGLASRFEWAGISGTNTVNSWTGTNSWTSTAGQHSYLAIRPDMYNSLQEQINQLLQDKKSTYMAAMMTGGMIVLSGGLV